MSWFFFVDAGTAAQPDTESEVMGFVESDWLLGELPMVGPYKSNLCYERLRVTSNLGLDPH